MAIIAICRGTMSGGRALAEALSADLGYPMLGREVAQEAADRLDVSETLLREKMERAPGLWERYASMRRVYVVAVQAALAEHVAEGNLVYHGLAGGLLLRGVPAVVRVRLIAPLSMRVVTLMETQGCDAAEAERHIAQVDAERAKWVQMMYGEDIEDPALYDMVINLETMPVRSASALIATAVRQPDFQLTDETRALLEDFRLACRVKLELARASDTRGFSLDVKARNGAVEISGSAPMLSSGKTGDRIAEIARGVAGVSDVRLKLQWFDPYP
jgi:cytidylate kinase